MSAISKKIGEITLRDFKVLFDRPGFYRFHFKTVDEDYGMVKEEVCLYKKENHFHDFMDFLARLLPFFFILHKIL